MVLISLKNKKKLFVLRLKKKRLVSFLNFPSCRQDELCKFLDDFFPYLRSHVLSPTTILLRFACWKSNCGTSVFTATRHTFLSPS